jgi:hypothetical protein
MWYVSVEFSNGSEEYYKSQSFDIAAQKARELEKENAVDGNNRINLSNEPVNLDDEEHESLDN